MDTTSTSSDRDIQQRVEQELEWDPRVDAAGIAVKVKNGVVTLTGVVDSYAKKIAACDGVHRVSGARDIADEVEVRIRPHVRSDHDIAQAVRTALIWDVFVPDERIHSRVTDGWVTLEGSVDRWQQREDAARCVERLSGVRGVTSHIAIEAPAVDTAKLRASIEGALTRHAQREARRITVAVDRGVVTLGGSVDSWAEKNAIGRLAAYSPGVVQLKNEIRIDSLAKAAGDPPRRGTRP